MEINALNPGQAETANGQITESSIPKQAAVGITSRLYSGQDSLLAGNKEKQGMADKVLAILTRKPKQIQSDHNLTASIDSQNKVHVQTEDGYKISFSGKRQEWTITSAEGKTTRIWGDPHVEESDGDKWDFLETSSFLFGNNKVTVETSPAPNGATYSKTVTIYNGKDRFTISDLDINRPKIKAWDLDGEEHDATLDDGTTYRLKPEPEGRESWIRE